MGERLRARRWPSECVPVGRHVNPQVACVSPMMLHHDEDEAIDRGVEGANFFGYSLGHYYVFGTHRPAVTNVWAEYEQRRSAQGFDPRPWPQPSKEERLGAKVAAGDTTGLRGCIGTPEQAREYLRRYEEAGVDQVIFVLQAGRNRHDAHHGVDRALRSRGASRVRRARRGGVERPRPSASPRSSRRHSLDGPLPTSRSTSATTSSRRCPRQWADATGSEELGRPARPVRRRPRRRPRRHRARNPRLRS